MTEKKDKLDAEKAHVAPREYSEFDADVNPRLGGFVDVVDGEHAGRYGVYEETIAHNEKTGLPSVLRVRTRDANNELLIVDAADVRRAGYKAKA